MQTLSSTPRWLRNLVWVISALAAVFCLALPLASRRHLFFPIGYPFGDALVYRGRFTLYHSAKFFTSHAFSAFAYPAGAAPIYALLYKTRNPILTFKLFALCTTLGALSAAYLFLRRRNIVDLFGPMLLLSFPLVFLIRQANIEIVLWVIVALGILAYRRGLGFVAATLFGVAAAVKLYPIFLLGLFLKRRRDLPVFFVGIAVFLVAMLAAIAYAGPTFSIAANGFFHGLSRFQDEYVDNTSVTEAMFDHCLFSPFKYLALGHRATHGPATMAHWRLTYYAVAGLMAILLFLRVRTFPFINRVLFLVVAMVSLPPVSFTYTLVHLYVPMFLLIDVLLPYSKRPPATALAALALLLLLMLPFVALTLFNIPAGPAQSVVIFALLLVSAIRPWTGPSGTVTPA